MLESVARTFKVFPRDAPDVLIIYPLTITFTPLAGIISLCWLFGSIIGFLPVFGWHNEAQKQRCFFTEIMDYNYLVFLYFTTIITPALILAVFYGLIYRVILKQVSTYAVLQIAFMTRWGVAWVIPFVTLKIFFFCLIPETGQ